MVRLDSQPANAYLTAILSVSLREVIALSRPDWSRPLPRPLNIPTVMKLSTLADMRDLVEKHLPY